MEIIYALQEQFTAAADAQAARAMAAYMKTTMPFYGIRSGDRRLMIKELLERYPIQNQTTYANVVAGLWAQPHREEKYAAIDIARRYKSYQTIEMMDLYETMIREGAWWDFVDDIAINLVGPVLAHNQAIMWPLMEHWISDPHLWIRRTAIICQNKFKNKTDAERLFAFCLQRAHEKEFFMRKAIGWALREYAKTEHQAVYTFVERHKALLSGLSYREAVKRRTLFHGTIIR